MSRYSPIASSRLHTEYMPLDERSHTLQLKGQCVVAWPLAYGVIRWDDADTGDYVVRCCISRHFFSDDAWTFRNAREEAKTSPTIHFQVVKLLD
jgi:hypothetical protein